MIKKRLFYSILLILLMLGMSYSAVAAQTYYFRVDRSEVNFYVESDGSVFIEYTYTFYNDPSADPIEYVDIGMPNDNYSISQIFAEIDGNTITDITSSPYVNHGYALGLGSRSIQPGASGTVHTVAGPVSGMLYFGQVDAEEDYASFQFSPNYFDSDLAYGSTDMSVNLILPPGLKAEEPRYFTPQKWPGSDEPISGMTSDGRAYYQWQSKDATSSREYIFGGAFPARLIPQDTIVKEPSGFENLIGAVGNFFSSGSVCFCGFFLIFIGFFVLSIYQSTVGVKKRKLKYLPPKISIEGHGIKRGLTAVEAAVLMEQPMDKIMTMILFGTIKKNAATVVKQNPLTLEVAPTLPEGLRSYETEFLEAFKIEKLADRNRKLQDTMINLVKSVTQKIKGFSRKETVAYYEKIIQEAWNQVETAETPEVKVEKYDKYMDWTMMDGDFNDRTERTFSSGPVFVPVWWGRYDPTFRPAASTSAGIPGGQATVSTSGGGKSVSMPSLPGSAFAASMINGVQTFSAGVVGDLTRFTSGVTEKTNPIPKTTSSSIGKGGGFHGGGGGGCACACACAGCACACAGGGR